MAVRAVREWWQVALATVLTASIIVIFILLIPALGKLSDQAAAGQQAKDRQCSTFPASSKVYDHARQMGIISRQDLAAFYRTAPKGCP